MKSIILSIAFVVGSTAQASLYDPAQFDKVSELVHFNVDPEMFPSQVLSAEVIVNEVTHKATLNVEHRICDGVGTHDVVVCAGYSAVKSLTFDIVNKTSGYCGETVYLAQPLRVSSIGGTFEELVIVDESTMHCDLFLPDDQVVQVTYSRVTPGSPLYSRILTSTFSGRAFQFHFSRN